MNHEPTAARPDETDPTLTFVGTATTLLGLGDVTLLTDPNFLHRGDRVHLGYGLTSKRLTEPALQPEDLPTLDGVVLSHLHGDHFDNVARNRLDKGLPIVTTQHGARKLERWGFRETRPLRTWEEHEFRRGTDVVRITSCPGQHGPAVIHHALPPVMGSVVELERAGTRVWRGYITGDTLCRPYLSQVTERFPDLDAVIVHLGGTKVLGVMVTMDGRQGADLLEMLRPPLTIPVHYDDYTVFRSPLTDFTEEKSSAADSTARYAPSRGARPSPCRSEADDREAAPAAPPSLSQRR